MSLNQFLGPYSTCSWAREFWKKWVDVIIWLGLNKGLPTRPWCCKTEIPCVGVGLLRDSVSLGMPCTLTTEPVLVKSIVLLVGEGYRQSQPHNKKFISWFGWLGGFRNVALSMKDFQCMLKLKTAGWKERLSRTEFQLWVESWSYLALFGPV